MPGYRLRATGYRGAGLGLLGLAIAFIPTAQALAAPLTMTIDRTEATLDDRLYLSVQVEGRGEPQLPALTDFELYSRGTSSQIQIINGQMSQSVVHNYILVPKRAGTFTVGPATMQLDGQEVQSNIIRVTILEGGARAPRETSELFVSADLSKTRAYVGEQLTYTWRFYRRVRIGNARVELPDFNGFVVEDLGEQKDYETMLNGVAYQVTELKKALFPQSVGTQELPQAKLTCEVATQRRRGSGGDGFFDSPNTPFGGFFGRGHVESRTLATKAFAVEVQALPQAPAGASALVGQFEVLTQLSRPSVAVGQSVTLTLIVRGTGNVQMVAPPDVPGLSAFKVYDDPPVATTDKSGGSVSGQKVFKRALVPTSVGDHTLGPATLTYFDPKEGIYRTARSAALALHVDPGAGGEDLRLTESITPQLGKVAVKILANDILPIRRDMALVRGWPAWSTRLSLGAMFGLPPLLYAGLLLTQHRRSRSDDSKLADRRRRALKKHQAALRRLRSTKAPKAAPGVSLAVRAFVGDKLGLEGSALTAKEATERLRLAGVSDPLCIDIESLLRACDAIQYGSGAQNGDADLAKSGDVLLHKLEQELRA